MTQNTSTAAKELARQYQAMCEHIGGCSDGNCIIVRRHGMHTNGGCKCWLRMNSQDVQRLVGTARRLAESVLTHRETE